MTDSSRVRHTRYRK